MSNIFYLSETVYSVRYKPCCYLQHDDKCSQLGELHSTGDRNSNQVSSSSPGTRHHLSRETVVILLPRHQCPHKALQEFEDFLYFWYQATRSLAWASTWPGQVVVTQPWLSACLTAAIVTGRGEVKKFNSGFFGKVGTIQKLGTFPDIHVAKKVKGGIKVWSFYSHHFFLLVANQTQSRWRRNSHISVTLPSCHIKILTTISPLLSLLLVSNEVGLSRLTTDTYNRKRVPSLPTSFLTSSWLPGQCVGVCNCNSPLYLDQGGAEGRSLV